MRRCGDKSVLMVNTAFWKSPALEMTTQVLMSTSCTRWNPEKWSARWRSRITTVCSRSILGLRLRESQRQASRREKTTVSVWSRPRTGRYWPPTPDWTIQDGRSILPSKTCFIRKMATWFLQSWLPMVVIAEKGRPDVIRQLTSVFIYSTRTMPKLFDVCNTVATLAERIHVLWTICQFSPIVEVEWLSF